MIIDRHISREIIRPFCTGLGLLVLIFIGFSAARQLTLAASGQLDMLTALKLVSLNTLITLEILLPSAFFFSVLSAIGRLYRDSEMSALYAAGVSRARILQAVLKLALVIALTTGLMSTLGRPWAFRPSHASESQAAAQFDLKQMPPPIHISEPTRLLSKPYALFCLKKKNPLPAPPTPSTTSPPHHTHT